jgi:hypothetical protein
MRQQNTGTEDMTQNKKPKSSDACDAAFVIFAKMDSERLVAFHQSKSTVGLIEHYQDRFHPHYIECL